MNKIILVDGNNLLFRSYYATAYNGNFMNNSKGFPTNALFGFTNMMHKIINEENPQYIIVAFDKGKTFRHDKYPDYKGGRESTPDELKKQFPVAKEMLTAMGIKYFEIDNYEADDIIGTFAKYCDLEPDFIGTIVSSDKDLLQLLSHDVDIKLLKQKDYIRYNAKTFEDAYGFEPVHMTDLKALMGDSSDNIKGVKGVGEKTALKLISEYKTIDNLYNHIDDIKGSLHDKLVNGKDDAYASLDLVTIVKDVPMDITIKDIKYNGPKNDELNKIYEDLEFYSFIRKEQVKPKVINEDVKIITDIKDLVVTEPSAIFLEVNGTNYHKSEVVGMSLYNPKESYFIMPNILKENPNFLTSVEKYTYDLKKTYVALKWMCVKLDKVNFDTEISAYLLDCNLKDDIAYLANTYNYDVPFNENVYKKGVVPDIKDLAKISVLKSQFVYETREKLIKDMEDKGLTRLFNDIEMPLAITLGDMEYDGVNVDKKVLDEMGEELKIKIELIEQNIYNNAGHKFNISSPKQLGVVLFDELGLYTNKKTKSGYSTNIDVLKKLQGVHPIIDQIMQYRTYTKLYSTYVEGLKTYIMPDNKIHTIYTNTLTRTGRLSSIEPNLQNIPARNDEGKMVRKAFLPSTGNVIVSGDYSQIELRILAHMSNVPALIQAFKEDMDIHTKTAMDLYKVDTVTSKQRRIAKAVNFGIIYGISPFGLSENTGLTPKEASEFIDNYFKTYPGVKDYMNKVIKEAEETKYVRTLFGRIRNIEELSNKNSLIRKQGERMALNTPIQGTAADIIKKAMVEMHDRLIKEKMKTKMILQVHDELVFDCPKDELDKLSKIIDDVMDNTVKLSVPLKVDVEYGDDWYQAK